MRLIIIPFDDEQIVIESDILEIESENINKILSSLNYIMKDKLYQIEVYKNIKDNLIVQLGDLAAIGVFNYNKNNHKIWFENQPYEKTLELISAYLTKTGSEDIHNNFLIKKEEEKRLEKEKFEKWKTNYTPNLKKEKQKNYLINLSALVVVGLVFTLIYYLWLDDVKFFNKRVSETKAVVIETKYYHFSGGYYKQKVTYEFVFDGKNYTNTFNAGRMEGKHNLGDSVLVKFATYNPKISRYLNN